VDHRKTTLAYFSILVYPVHDFCFVLFCHFLKKYLLKIISENRFGKSALRPFKKCIAGYWTPKTNVYRSRVLEWVQLCWRTWQLKYAWFLLHLFCDFLKKYLLKIISENTVGKSFLRAFQPCMARYWTPKTIFYRSRVLELVHMLAFLVYVTSDM